MVANIIKNRLFFFFFLERFVIEQMQLQEPKSRLRKNNNWMCCFHQNVIKISMAAAAALKGNSWVDAGFVIN